MYITLYQHDVEKIKEHVAYGTTYLMEVLEYLGKSVPLQLAHPKYYHGCVVYRVTMAANPTLTEVASHYDTSD